MASKAIEDIQIIDFSQIKKTDKKSKSKQAKTNDQSNLKPDEKQIEQKVEEEKIENVVQQIILKQTPEQEQPQPYQENFNDPFTYQDMLKRITGLLADSVMETNQKFQVQPPQIAKIQGKRTQCTNFVDICLQLNRQPEHLCEFFLTELGARGAVSENSLILKGHFYMKSFEAILGKYYNEYVKCPSCLNGNTELIKDQQTRSHKLTCNNCLSSRYVKDIESGYQALKKGQRRKDRMK